MQLDSSTAWPGSIFVLCTAPLVLLLRPVALQDLLLLFLIGFAALVHHLGLLAARPSQPARGTGRHPRGPPPRGERPASLRPRRRGSRRRPEVYTSLHLTRRSWTGRALGAVGLGVRFG